MHFLGGPTRASVEIEIRDGPEVLGRQPVVLLTKDTAFTCTAITRSRPQMLDHQRRFLMHTPLAALQWINLNHSSIEFTTITK